MAGLRPLHALLLIPLLGGGRHASDLAETLGVSRQAVAQVVTRLEGDGYLTRITDPGDARARLICLTPRGRAALRTMRASARALEDDWRERLGAEQLASFRETLLTLLSATSVLPSPPAAPPRAVGCCRPAQLAHPWEPRQ